MNVHKTEDEKLLIKWLISAIVNFFLCVIFFCVIYDIGNNARGEFAAGRKIIDISFMVLIYAAALISHFAVYRKEPRFIKKGYKIVYWAVTVLFMNPYMFYAMLYAID